MPRKKTISTFSSSSCFWVSGRGLLFCGFMLWYWSFMSSKRCLCVWVECFIAFSFFILSRTSFSSTVRADCTTKISVNYKLFAGDSVTTGNLTGWYQKWKKGFKKTFYFLFIVNNWNKGSFNLTFTDMFLNEAFSTPRPWKTSLISCSSPWTPWPIYPSVRLYFKYGYILRLWVFVCS